MSVHILIPSYNPDQHLLHLIEDLTIKKFQIVLIDDGSSCDKSKLILKKIVTSFPNVVFIQHPINKGKGEAIKSGLKFIINTFNSKPSVVTTDGDGQHLISDIVKITSKIEDSPESFFLGVRDFSRNTPWKSAVGNQITSFFLKLFFGKSISDSQTGLRAIPNPLLSQMLKIKGARYEYETSVLLYLIKNEIKINCIPIQTVYFDKNKNTNFRAGKDSWRILKVILKNLF